MLDVRGMSSVTDFFVVAGAKSSTQLQALAKNVVEDLKKKNDESPVGKEGLNGQAPWALIDYETVMVHIFLSEARGLYALERLYPEAKTVLTIVE